MCPCRTLDVTLDLKDPQYPEQNLGTLELAVTLSPKEGDVKDAVRGLLKMPPICVFLFLIPSLAAKVLVFSGVVYFPVPAVNNHLLSNKPNKTEYLNKV